MNINIHEDDTAVNCNIIRPHVSPFYKRCYYDIFNGVLGRQDRAQRQTFCTCNKSGNVKNY